MTACGTCGTELPGNAKFCNECGSRITLSHSVAEYKQVTVLFADVVHSMEIAAAVGPERLREIMTDVLQRCTTVVKRYGGTVDKFTGDGVMALFGAPVALEDHALRACLAALDIHKEVEPLAADVNGPDGIDLQLRIGLNSGQVIAGEIGSSPLSYTAIGAQVGMAQRMESAAPPGGVMLSESTARLVEHGAVLGDPELVKIKGAPDAVPARRLLATAVDHPRIGRHEPTLVGRTWEMIALTGILDQSVNSHGCVVSVVGPPGIGKSRLVREVKERANGLGVEVFSTYCESHTCDIPFHAVARLLRATTGVSELDGDAARARVGSQVPDTDAEDLVLLHDLLGIGTPDVALPGIDPDARRRRLTALVNAASLARTEPAVYVIEDAHWIDEVSESMLGDFLAVIPQTRSLVLVTYRPEYHGVLSRTPGSQMIALAPLDNSQTSVLTAELLGSNPSLAELAAQITERAAGNPFFAEEMVRDLAERGVLEGSRGEYAHNGEVADVSVPATLQATIASRIDRLDTTAKRTMNAAAVIGSRFGGDLLAALVDDSRLDELIRDELIDQVKFGPHAEYEFRHPLIRTVAYESQLKSTRAELHRRLACVIEQRSPDAVAQYAALIAEHLEAAGDLHAAFGWHMRTGAWSTNRDFGAARTSWQRARQVADRLPPDDPDRMAMRIAPRTLLCGSSWRAGGSIADTGFDELHELCTTVGDKRSLAIGMAGLVMALLAHNHISEASRLASEHVLLLESIGDPSLTVGLSFAATASKHEAGEMAEVLRLSQRVIDLADGDPSMGNLFIGSPLALATTWRGAARGCLGIPGWRDDLAKGVAIARTMDPISHIITVVFHYVVAIPNGVLPADATALRDTAEALEIAERSGDDVALDLARAARGVALVNQTGPQREHGFELLAQLRASALQERSTMTGVAIVDYHMARQKAAVGNVDGAIVLARAVLDDLLASGGLNWINPVTGVLVEALLTRNAEGDVQEARAAIDRLAAVPADPGLVLRDLPLLRLRALLARAEGDEDAYREFRDRYRAIAFDLGIEGHMAIAEAMP